jgi:DNA polymerase-3 subunit beta
MKAVVSTTALANALSLIGGVVRGRAVKLALACIKIIADEDGLHLHATDLEIACRYDLDGALDGEVRVVEPGEVLVPADRIIGVVRESKDDALTIETDGTTCTITGASSRFKLFGRAPEEFPVTITDDVADDVTIPSDVLADLIRKTAFAVADDGSRYAINGVLIEVESDTIHMAATDGRRLSCASADLDTPGRAGLAVLPTRLLRLATKLTGTVHIDLDGTRAYLVSGNVCLTGNLLQGSFPKYQDIIPTTTTTTVTADRTTLLQQIRQAALMTSKESKGVRMLIGEASMTVKSCSSERGNAAVWAPVEVEGDPIEIGFNPALLLDVLKAADGERVSIEMTTPNKPGLVRCGNMIYVLMPTNLG